MAGCVRAARGLSRVLPLHLALHLQPTRALAKAEAWDACTGDPLYAPQPLAPALRAWSRLARLLGWPDGLCDTRAPVAWPPGAGEAAVRAACAELSAAWQLRPLAPGGSTLRWLRALLREVRPDSESHPRCACALTLSLIALPQSFRTKLSLLHTRDNTVLSRHTARGTLSAHSPPHRDECNALARTAVPQVQHTAHSFSPRFARPAVCLSMRTQCLGARLVKSASDFSLVRHRELETYAHWVCAPPPPPRPARKRPRDG